MANALQQDLGLPAPAVSISGADGYGLWLSLAAPVPLAMAQTFRELVHRAYFPEAHLHPKAAATPVELPPCLHAVSNKWAAFINPGLGASFADEPGLDMMPPLAGQVALLESLASATPAQFAHAMLLLRDAHGEPEPGLHAKPASAQAKAGADAADAADAATGLLLKDASLEDIVRHLHARNIEPTFRHLIKPG